MWPLRSKDKSNQEKADALIGMFQSFDVDLELSGIRDGRTALYIDLKAKKPVRMKTLREFEDDACYALGVKEVQIEAPIRGTSLIGIRIPKEKVEMLTWKELHESPTYQESEKDLAIPLGKDEFNNDVVANLFSLGHLIVTGETGTGKSVLLHNIICSLISRRGPDRVRFILDDAKRVEFGYHYNGIPHLLTPTLTDARKSVLALKWLNKEMDRRFSILEEKECSNIEEYHQKVVAPAVENESTEEMPEAMPYILMIFDEFADIMMRYPKEAEAAIVPLTQMARAVGIHLIITTSRPSAKILTGMIRANISPRVAFRVSSSSDSRACIDTNDCTKLRGQADAHYLFFDGNEYVQQRIQTARITDDEIKEIASAIREKYAEDDMFASQLVPVEKYWKSNSRTIFAIESDQSEYDGLYGEAVEAVREAGKASTSYLQRKLGIGYSRAARLIDLLEEGGVIGPGDGATPREVIESDET